MNWETWPVPEQVVDSAEARLHSVWTNTRKLGGQMKRAAFFGVFLLFFVLGCRTSHAPQTLDISEQWRFSPDSGNRGIAEKWYAVDFNDADWAILDAGKRWEDQGFPNLDGYAWYRKRVQIPASWKGKKVWLKFRGVNDAYVLFVNGARADSCGQSHHSFASRPSIAEISGHLKFGQTNVFALRVNDWGNSGGLWRRPVLVTTDESQTRLFEPISKKPFDPGKAGYTLFWHDEFNGNRLDTTKWRHRALGPRRAGFGTPDAVRVANGYLQIRAYMEHDTLKVGAISTEGIRGFRYGYFECRAKLPKTTGPWAAFWIQSPLISAGEDPAKFGTEIDIFEYFKNEGGDFVSHCLHWAYGPHQQTSGAFLSRVKGIGEGFHTFGLEWTPEKYVFLVDGLQYHVVKQAVSHIPESIILSFEPCSKEALKTATLPDVFTVDYVRVYKKKK